MTCYNRRVSTLQCLNSVYSQSQREPRSLTLYIVDDKSKDGTAEAIKAEYPEVKLIAGTGDLYWNRGMHVAFEEAMKEDFDYYLWLNDDTLLYPNAFDTMFETMHGLQKEGIISIVTGATCDPESGKMTYGGINLVGKLRRELVWIDPMQDMSQACDTMNGNCTLIPRAVVQKLGNLDPAFHHSFGDMDYGFRANRAGYKVYLAPGFIGTCRGNSKAGTWRDETAPLSVRWRNLNSAKGSPFSQWSLYCRRYLGPLWPLYAVSPYVKTLASGLLKSR